MLMVSVIRIVRCAVMMQRRAVSLRRFQEMPDQRESLDLLENLDHLEILEILEEPRPIKRKIG
jgi:hypothetical protein